MKIHFNCLRLAFILLSGSFLFTACTKTNSHLLPESEIFSKANSSKQTERGIEFFALSDNNELVRYTTGRPLAELGSISITNLQTSEKILAIDFRPATGQLYGVSNRAVFILSITSVVELLLLARSFYTCHQWNKCCI